MSYFSLLLAFIAGLCTSMSLFLTCWRDGTWKVLAFAAVSLAVLSVLITHGVTKGPTNPTNRSSGDAIHSSVRTDCSVCYSILI